MGGSGAATKPVGLVSLSHQIFNRRLELESHTKCSCDWFSRERGPCQDVWVCWGPEGHRQGLSSKLYECFRLVPAQTPAYSKAQSSPVPIVIWYKETDVYFTINPIKQNVKKILVFQILFLFKDIVIICQKLWTGFFCENRTFCIIAKKFDKISYQ